MINFKEHDGLLFKMLDKPVPLTADSNMPCLVRLIQDDSPMGKYNRDAAYFDVIGKLFIAQKIKENPYYNNKLHAYEKNSINQDYCIASIHTLEIIGYPVADGTKEWALHQIMQGEKVCHKKSPSIMYCKRDSKIMREVRCGCVDFMSIDAWLNGADNTGWQIYEEPKPTFKVGDWVDCKDPVGVPTQCKVLEILEHNVIVECKTGHRWSLPHNNITRKLSPSEIIVKIGCLSGTIGKSCEPACFLMWHSNPKMDFNYSIIRFSALDTQTRELVESLLEAQEEE